jgi:uncharacterized protein (DUF2236 family)
VEKLRRAVVDPINELVGTLDEVELYGGPAGDLGLVGGPESMSWELHSDMASIAAAGLGAIVMEILHPAVMAGVHDQSTYQTQPLRRARNTLGYVVITTFGNTEAATRTIDRVHKIHSRVNGAMPDGRPYEALDPTLIGWVHTAIPWAIMQMFDRLRRPLTVEEKNRYLAEQAIIGRMGGAGEIPETVDDLRDYVEAMRPQLAVNEQTREFIDFLLGDVDGYDAGTAELLNRRISLQQSMSLMPVWARRMAGVHHSDSAQRLFFEPTMRAQANLIRWAYGTPAYRRLADARVAGTDVGRLAA